MTNQESPAATLSLAELLRRLNGHPLYINTSLGEGEVPTSLMQTLQAETLLCVMRHANTATSDEHAPVDFCLWHIQRVLAGDLPVPQHLLLDALADESSNRDEAHLDEIATALRQHIAYGTYRYLERFPERSTAADTEIQELGRQFEEVVAEGYTDPELDELLARDDLD